MAESKSLVVRWANTANPLDVVYPTSGVEAAGYLDGEPLPHEEFNGIIKRIGDWTPLLDDAFLDSARLKLGSSNAQLEMLDDTLDLNGDNLVTTLDFWGGPVPFNTRLQVGSIELNARSSDDVVFEFGKDQRGLGKLTADSPTEVRLRLDHRAAGGVFTLETDDLVANQNIDCAEIVRAGDLLLTANGLQFDGGVAKLREVVTSSPPFSNIFLDSGTTSAVPTALNVDSIVARAKDSSNNLTNLGTVAEFNTLAGRTVVEADSVSVANTDLVYFKSGGTPPRRSAIRSDNQFVRHGITFEETTPLIAVPGLLATTLTSQNMCRAKCTIALDIVTGGVYAAPLVIPNSSWNIRDVYVVGTNLRIEFADPVPRAAVTAMVQKNWTEGAIVAGSLGVNVVQYSEIPTITTSVWNSGTYIEISPAFLRISPSILLIPEIGRTGMDDVVGGTTYVHVVAH